MSQTPTSIIQSCHESSGLEIRPDLTAAHAHVWEKLAAPGTWWNGAERLAMAEVVRTALDDPDPTPPWVSASSSGRVAHNPALSSQLQDAVYRLTRHAGTLTEDWYLSMRDATAITHQQWVEVIDVVISVASVLRFAQLTGIDRPEFPTALDGEPLRQEQPSKPANHRDASRSAQPAFVALGRNRFILRSTVFIRNRSCLLCEWGSINAPIIDCSLKSDFEVVFFLQVGLIGIIALLFNN